MSKSERDVSKTLEELTGRLSGAARELVAWFLEQMPESYFEDIDATTRLEHLGAILALRAVGQEPRLRLKSADGRRITHILPEDAPGTLTRLMRDFSEGPIRAAKIYSSRDKRIIVDVFDIGRSPPCNLDLPDLREKYLSTLALSERRLSAGGDPLWPATDVIHHFTGLTEDYVRACSPERILGHAELCREVRRHTAAVVKLDNGAAGRSRLVIACANVSSTSLFLRVANRLSTLSIDVTRAHVDTMFADAEEPVVIISALVAGPDGRPIDPASTLWQRLHGDLRRLEWLDAETLELGYREPALDLDGADLLMTYADLAHQLLVKTNRYLYTRSRIDDVLRAQLPLAIELVELFRARFDPRRPLSDQAYRDGEHRLGRAIDEGVEDDGAAAVLRTILKAIGATLKTNYFVPGRFALALRLTPALIPRPGPGPETSAAPEGEPTDGLHGVFWVHGRGFNAFHMRFRDTARGGVRVVRPASSEQHLRESERHLDEAYALAYAQELKNKDIPEGGAKAVLLVHPARDVTPCVRAFTDAMLDLITADPATRAQVVDRAGAPESIYFGPDENITPKHINWIVARARDRGYATPSALMSSKPDAGINHKQYGVTSEGVNVFLEVALRAIGIDPRRQPFTLKLTGGPDGDVAGNEIKIAIREFGAQVRIVGVADGLGCAEDPAGLDHGELLRLCAENRPIIAFDRGKLSAKGRVVAATDPEGARARNDLHNRVVADVFVPAGGRPGTINADNWSRFLRPDGRPASRLIVEGANLFLTQDARRHLAEAGVLIIKDSSANKCGVICSSYEVLAGLLLTDAELMAIKPAFVVQVIERLRRAARLEAELLMETHRRRPATPLYEVSIQLSQQINRLASALAAGYPRLAQEYPALVREAVLAHVPPALVEAAGERVFTQLPASYRAQLVCTTIAASIVYREGLDYFRDVPPDRLAALALDYVLADRANRELIAEVERSGLTSAPQIARLLEAGGTRAALKSGRRDQ
ncbi:MAG TPA: NAD-glutamate dehydrogenase domain-containing protein [Polyangia bacterium]|jgi:glutamate dehydrogenase|nr:NAD-glutamate dehydrogenase domain-containing protein [Polyangia bacterium]